MKFIILFAAFAWACFSPRASAQSRSGERAETIRYADLDLRRPEDIRTLDRRIARAAARLCGAVSDADPAGQNVVRRCRRQAVTSAADGRSRAISALTEAGVEMAVRRR